MGRLPRAGSNPAPGVIYFYNFDNILSNKNLKGTTYSIIHEILPGKIHKNIYLKKYLSNDILRKFERYLINRDIYKLQALNVAKKASLFGLGDELEQ